MRCDMRHSTFSFGEEYVSHLKCQYMFFFNATNLRAQPFCQFGFAVFLTSAHIKIKESLATLGKRNLVAWNRILTLCQRHKPHQAARAARMRTLGVIEIQASRRIAKQNAGMSRDSGNPFVISVFQE